MALTWALTLFKSILGGSLMYSMFHTFLMRPTSDNPAHERRAALAMANGCAALAAGTRRIMQDIDIVTLDCVFSGRNKTRVLQFEAKT